VSDEHEMAPYAAALRAELTSLQIPLSCESRDTLHTCVCECVDGMKAIGWPPERVIVAVKRIATDAGLRPSSRTVLPEKTLTGVDRVLVEIVGWCIERYYANRSP
jgi:hypothetical protein